jgi:hypothetical protein
MITAMECQNPEQVIIDIYEDYKQNQGIFDEATLHINDVLRELEQEGLIKDERDRALFITLRTALNYLKPSERLTYRVQGLWRSESNPKPWLFYPEILVGDDRYEDLFDLFKGKGEYENHPVIEEYGRMENGKTDIGIWYTIAASLYEDYNSNPMKLFESLDNDATVIFDHMKDARREAPAHPNINTTKAFPSLGGMKVGPLWLRIIDDLVVDLDNIALIPIPVDVQIARVTNRLFGTDFDADEADDREEIREIYREFCREHGYTDTKIDEPLWLIGENWDDGGEEYLDQK